MFAEVDKFVAHVLAIPSAAGHPDVERYVDLLAVGKEQLRLALAEAIAHKKVHQAKLAALEQAARQRKEDYEKKAEELNTPSPPLDAKGLGPRFVEEPGRHRLKVLADGRTRAVGAEIDSFVPLREATLRRLWR